MSLLAISPELPDITLSDIDGEPRARDIDIAERLGYERPRAIRELIERNRAELEAFGPLAVQRGKSRGQDFTEYWLTEEQALLISARSDAENAAQVRHMLIKVFVAWRRGHLAAVDRRPTVAEMFLQSAEVLLEIEKKQSVQAERIAETERRLDQIETATDHFTCLGYASWAKKTSISLKDASALGRKASKRCRDLGIQISKIPDPRFGTVNQFPKWILDEVWDEKFGTGAA